MRRTLLISFSLTLLLVLAAPSWAGRTRYADPTLAGPFGVGHTVFTASDPARGDRTLLVELWYPVDPEEAVGDATFYDFQFFGLGLVSPVAIEDAPVSGGLSFPLVVFSHGSGGVSYQSTPLMEALASHGMIVVSPNHKGNTANDFLGGTTDPFLVVAENRPLDLSFLIDLLLARNLDPSDPLYAKINPNRIGAAGHSFGGFTALAMASGFEVESEGIDVAPDPRVKAIAPIAPASGILSDTELESIEIPMFLLGGTLDTTTPIDDETTRPFALVPGRPLYRADITGATHLQFANVCDIGQALLDFGVDLDGITRIGIDYVDNCLPPALAIDTVRDIQSHYLSAFFKRHLLRDDRYDVFLTEDWALANQPQVTFFRKDAPD